ncbi:zinc ribbon domain-containing protein [Streptomyces sp. NPDC057197]|uniref:NADase-type glycan-binding domain-containing protein n=1 Tax=Streptomyces sp. NPDC057197 TaxID=3346045 RepID=UPI0036255337
MTTPQNCAECGTRAEPGQSFCDACGAVLSWTGPAASRVPAPAGPADASRGRAEDASDAAPAAPSGGSGSSGGSGGSGHAPADTSVRDSAPSGPSAAPATPAPEGAVGTAPEPRPLPAQGAAPGPDRSEEDDTLPGLRIIPDPAAAPPPHDPYRQPAAPHAPQGAPFAGDPEATVPQPPAAQFPDGAPMPGAPAPGGPEDPAERARRLLIPVSDPQAPPAPEPAVAPVLPGRPAPQRPQAVRAPGEELGLDGGLPCPWCGTRNRPERHYCTRCAMPMAGDRQAPGRLPWWRRLTRAGDREAPWAGDRPRLRRAFDRVLAWVGAAIVVTLLIVAAVNIPSGVQATRDHFAKRAPVAPDTYRASRSYPGHKPDLAFDKINNTWWGPGVADSGKGQWVEAHFNEPTRLLNIIITPGQSIRADQLSKSALPHRVQALITTADGKTTTRDLVLDQGPGPQPRAFRFGKVIAVRFTIESAYQPSPDKQVSIAEIEFLGPSHSNGS